MTELFVIKDYRDQFYFSTKYRGASVDLDLLKVYLKKHNILMIVKSFSEINFETEDYNNEWVLYQSSEDPAIYYKGYIEDIILGLEIQGAKLLPSFKYLKAHHNKVFMEILRQQSIGDSKIKSKLYGTYEEFFKDKDNLSYPVVIKPSIGTRSRGVCLAKNRFEAIRAVKKVSRSYTIENLKLIISGIVKNLPYTLISNHRKKFIVQNFINSGDGDYRVLIYAEKYYCLHRSNRKRDFRASGSGVFNFDSDLPEGLLDYAKKVFDKLDTPYASLDIGYDGETFFLFEFQCLAMGQYAMQKSKFYYSKKGYETWIKKYETPILEREIANSISVYIKEKKICAE